MSESKEHKVSFARVPGAGVETPATPVPPPSEVKADQAVPPSAGSELAAQNNSPATNALGFWTGDDEGSDNDPRDVRFPRINLVQGMSKADLKTIAPEGEFVLKKSLKIPKPFQAVIVGFRPKVWVEKLPWKDGKPVGEPRVAHSIDDVVKAGGTDNWGQSRECKGKDGMPKYSTPLFDAHITAMLLIARPEGFDDGNFPYVSEDNVAFAVALMTLKSTSFGSFYIPLNSERKGLFRGNFASRWIEVGAAQKTAWFPTARITTPTSPQVQALVTKILS